MKKLLRLLLDWMDRKWPDKVVLKLDDFNKLLKRIEEIEKKGIEEARIKAIEAEINKFNASLGFGAKGPISIAPFQR